MFTEKTWLAAEHSKPIELSLTTFTKEITILAKIIPYFKRHADFLVSKIKCREKTIFLKKQRKYVYSFLRKSSIEGLRPVNCGFKE